MKVTKRERNAMPVYLIALVWIFAVFALGVRSLPGYLGTVAASVAAFYLGRLIFPDKVWQEDAPEPEPADPEKAVLKQERQRAMGELRRLNDNITDEEISAQLSHMEEVTGKIFDHVMQNPSKRSAVRRFMDYYLPTTLALLNKYDRMDQLGVGGEHISAAKEKIRAMLATVSVAFDKQLDALFQDEYMDISAEITVLEQMMKQEGLTDQDMPGTIG